MKTCFNCNAQNGDEAIYCASCGANLSSGAPAEEKRFLDDCCRNLRHERRALRIVGIVFTVFAAVMAVLLFFMFIGEIATVSPVMDEVGDAADDVAYMGASIFMLALIYLFVYAAMFLAIGIVNLVSASRTGKAIDAVYTDFSVVVKRNGTAKRIVFGAFFNTIAMIFIIISFTKLKNNRALCERIIARQKVKQSPNNFN